MNVPASQRQRSGGASQSAAYAPQRQETVNVPPQSRSSGGEGPQTSAAVPPQTSGNAPQDTGGPQQSYAPQQNYTAQQNAPTSPRSYEPRQESTVNVPPSQRRSGGERQGYTRPQYTRPQYTQPQHLCSEGLRRRVLQ